jgi:hypothetical protein
MSSAADQRLNGVTMAELHTGIVARDAACTAWLAGSLLDGLGNPGSDIDVFVLSSERVSPSVVAKQLAHHDVVIRYVSGKRVDYEYWDSNHVKALLRRLARDDFSSETCNVLGLFDEDELALLHGVRIGRALHRPERFDELKAGLDVAALQSYLYELRCLYVDDAVDDAAGIYSEGDYQTAALRAREAVGFAIDCLLHSHGVTNHGQKHRLPLLRRLVESTPALAPELDAYWRVTSTIPPTHLGCKRFTERSLELVEDILHRTYAVVGRESQPRVRT